jgi:adenylate kinase
MHLVLIGPPGSGKSTLAELLGQHIPLTLISSGQRLRREIANSTPIGRRIGPLLEQGHFAPDDMMKRLVRGWLAELPPDQGFLLDGFPRTIAQAHTLDRLLQELQRPLDAVITLSIRQDEIIRRISGRRICQGGGPPFTLHIDDADAVERCRARGGQLTQRDDDQPAVVSERIHIYDQETAPLIAFYTARDLVRTIDAEQPAQMVTEQVLSALRA